MGSNPELPKAEDFLIPPMQVPKYAGWAVDASPKVPEDLKIEKLPMVFYILVSFIRFPMAIFSLSNQMAPVKK